MYITKEKNQYYLNVIKRVYMQARSRHETFWQT